MMHNTSRSIMVFVAMSIATLIAVSIVLSASVAAIPAGALSDAAHGGYITNIEISGYSYTNHWNGYYGWIATSESPMYNRSFNNSSVQYINTIQTLDVGSTPHDGDYILITNSSKVPIISNLRPGNNSIINTITGTGSDSGSSTFIKTSTYSLPPYGTNITNVPTTYTFVNNSSQFVSFREGMLEDQDGNLVFAVPIIKGPGYGYNNMYYNESTYFFQFMVPNNNSNIQTYYMYYVPYVPNYLSLMKIVHVNGSSGVELLKTNATFYYPGTDNTFIQSNLKGEINVSAATPPFFDAEFIQHNETLKVKLFNINASTIKDIILGADILETPSSGFLVTYGINTTIAYDNATVTINYSKLSYSDQDNLSLYKHNNWDFNNAAPMPGGTVWIKRNDAIQDKILKTFTINTTSFSGFSIKEDTSGVIIDGGGNAISSNISTSTNTKNVTDNIIKITTTTSTNNNTNNKEESTTSVPMDTNSDIEVPSKNSGSNGNSVLMAIFGSLYVLILGSFRIGYVSHIVFNDPAQTYFIKGLEQLSIKKAIIIGEKQASIESSPQNLRYIEKSFKKRVEVVRKNVDTANVFKTASYMISIIRGEQNRYREMLLNVTDVSKEITIASYIAAAITNAKVYSLIEPSVEGGDTLSIEHVVNMPHLPIDVSLRQQYAILYELSKTDIGSIEEFIEKVYPDIKKETEEYTSKISMLNHHINELMDSGLLDKYTNNDSVQIKPIEPIRTIWLKYMDGLND